MDNQKLKIGVSSCLLGDNVRHNGGNCNNHYLQNILSEYADFTPSCPEVAIGMSIPRPAVRLEQMKDQNETVIMRDPKSGNEYTDQMHSYSTLRAKELLNLDLDGYVFKKNSPSCGVFRVKLYINGHPAERRQTGLFAQHILDHIPDLPVEEEGRLCDPVLREHFLLRTFTFRRLKNFLKTDWTRGQLVEFHSAEKYLLMAHSPKLYKELGQLVAKIAEYSKDDFAEKYRALFMSAINQKATRGRNSNTLQHMMGYLKKDIETEGREQLALSIADYQAGLVPLIVPLTLMNLLLTRAKQDYLLKQTYLKPYPKELMLRNYI